ncbi:MAG TPA: pectin acetylesterase-family hydrolase, partial [Thermoanaerobaculia bacterium]|nr:pectin acetylesterase-family hydrolase [Thermoanaerobaculia bacterium]
MNPLVRFALVCSLAVTLAAQPVPNTCTDNYWVNSMRCKAVPGQPPQPNWGSVPTQASHVKTYTRVFVTNDTSVRCLDGTWPVIYVDPAVNGPSDKWIFTLTGGGARHPYDSDGDGLRDAIDIAETYAEATERDEMGTALEPPMKSFGGIHLRDFRNPTFRDYNRVRIEKCGYDRHMGRVSYETAPGTGYFTVTSPAGTPVSFDLWQHGWLILEEVLEMLGPGISYTTWRYENEQIVEDVASLPPLDEATNVLFVGHSAAAHGLMHNADRLASLLPQADVRALFDANFIPSMENEVGFDSTQLGATAYSGLWTGTTDRAVDPFTYDGSTYHLTMSFISDQYFTYGALNAGLDQSCVDTHSNVDPLLDTTWKCRDRHHVLLNHISTPYFIREDFTDDNKEHLYQGLAHTIQWGQKAAYSHCSPAGSLCLPQLDPTEYRDRLNAQVDALIFQSSADSELATGADPSMPAGSVFPTVHIWMPDCGKHEGAYDTAQFLNTTMTYRTYTYSMRTWLEGFMTLGRENFKSWYVDQMVYDGDLMTTQ